MVGSGSFVPGPFLVGFGGMKVGMFYGAPNIIFKPSRALHIFTHRNLIACFHVKLAPRILVWIQLPYAQSWSRHCAKMMLPCMSRSVAPTLNPTGPKQEASFLQETMPCIHGPSLYVWMPAVVVAVLIAYDYECAKELSASLFLGSQKQAFLASWLWALAVYI